MFNLRFTATAGTPKKTINIALNGVTIQTATSGETFVVPIITSEISPGNHKISVSITDANGKTDIKSATLTILEK